MQLKVGHCTLEVKTVPQHVKNTQLIECREACTVKFRFELGSDLADSLRMFPASVN